MNRLKKIQGQENHYHERIYESYAFLTYLSILHWYTITIIYISNRSLGYKYNELSANIRDLSIVFSALLFPWKFEQKFQKEYWKKNKRIAINKSILSFKYNLKTH